MIGLFDILARTLRSKSLTIKRVFSWMVGLPVAVVLVCFAVANRNWVTVSFDPVNTQSPWFSIAMPVFALFFAGIFCGLIVGGMMVWLRQGKWRKAARQGMVNDDRATGHSPERRLLQIR